MRLRATLAAVALSVLALAPMATAQASTHTTSGSGVTQAAACAYNYDWNVLYSGGPQYARANWDASCGLGMQTEAICYDAQTNTFYGKKSGVVYALGKWDTAFCLQGDPIQSGWIRFYDGSSWTSWHRFWLR